MQEFNTFNPSTLTQTITGFVFYAVIILITFFGFSTVFVLIKNGRSRALSFAVAVLYLVFFLTIAAQGVGILNSI
ncbi:MAG: hypothetical protein AAB948_03335 [Patescibacteria group bacterium]|jgi:hypothetical protein|uniref:Uncharacterized protein n=1 Tax=Candidatus Doudnabacteria bacterium Gr01-1014_77 TaxID=2017133 RepID=A0A554JA21_9BACT|nr:MAG: hypothetical protein G01um101477_577 [Candidatus Doudnabacteria bacterium Gr01-1014_77]